MEPPRILRGTSGVGRGVKVRKEFGAHGGVLMDKGDGRGGRWEHCCHSAIADGSGGCGDEWYQCKATAAQTGRAARIGVPEGMGAQQAAFPK